MGFNMLACDVRTIEDMAYFSNIIQNMTIFKDSSYRVKIQLRKGSESIYLALKTRQ